MKKEFLEFLKNKRCFLLQLCHYFPSKRESKRVINRFLLPLMDTERAVIHFGSASDTDGADFLSKEGVLKNRRYYIPAESFASPEGHEFLKLSEMKRGNLVWDNDLSANQLVEMIDPWDGPFCVVNMGVEIGRPAMNYVKKELDNGSSSTFFILSSANGVQCLYIASGKQRIIKLYNAFGGD